MLKNKTGGNIKNCQTSEDNTVIIGNQSHILPKKLAFHYKPLKTPNFSIKELIVSSEVTAPPSMPIDLKDVSINQHLELTNILMHCIFNRLNELKLVLVIMEK